MIKICYSSLYYKARSTVRVGKTRKTRQLLCLLSPLHVSVRVPVHVEAIRWLAFQALNFSIHARKNGAIKREQSVATCFFGPKNHQEKLMEGKAA